MQDFFFDTPYWFLGLLGVIGAALWISGNSRQIDRLKQSSFAVILIAVLLGVVSLLVDTDKEKVIKRTHQLIAAVEKQDKTTAEMLLLPQVALGDMDKRALVERIGTASTDFHITSIHISSLTVEPSGPDLSVMLSATANVDHPLWSGPVPSSWKLVWEKSGNNWLLRDISPINVPGVDMRTITGRLNPKPE
jgi:hypothetical protein